MKKPAVRADFRARRYAPKTCVACQRTYAPATAAQKWCSDECRAPARRAYWRNWRPDRTRVRQARQAQVSGRRPIFDPRWPSILEEARAELAAYDRRRPTFAESIAIGVDAA